MLKMSWCNKRSLRRCKGRSLSMVADEWEEMEAKGVSTISLSLAPEIKYNVLNEKSTSTWAKLEKIYMSNSLTNRLYLKKQLYSLKMSKWKDVREHITQLLSLKAKIETDDQAIILLSSLPGSYETLVTKLSFSCGILFSLKLSSVIKSEQT